MALKSQDLLVLLKLIARAERGWTFAQLATELGMSSSEVHASLRRAAISGLFYEESRAVNRPALLEFIEHGVKYAFPPERRGITRGLPTAHAAPPLRDHFAKTSDVPPVWGDPEGSTRGEELEPLYRSVPRAARADALLYELLALVDAVRAGRARERQLAVKELRVRLS